MQIDIFNQIEMYFADTLSILVYLAYEGYVQWSHNDTVQFDVCWLQHSSDKKGQLIENIPYLAFTGKWQGVYVVNIRGNLKVYVIICFRWV